MLESDGSLIQVDNMDSPEKLAAMTASTWARENRGFYLTLFSRCNKVTGVQLTQLVDEVLEKETSGIAREILRDPSSRDKWRQWLGWVNLIELLRLGLDPLKLQRAQG